MKYLIPLLIAGILMAGIPDVLNSQEVSLVELKKREEERRKNTKKSKLKIDDTNINQAGESGKPSGFVQVQSTGTAAQSNPDEQKRDQGSSLVPKSYPTSEDAWKSMRRNFEQRIKQLEEAVKKADDRIKQLWNEFYLKDLPNDLARIKADISMVGNQQNTDKANLEAVKVEYDQFLKNARKANIPPGWTRDR